MVCSRLRKEHGAEDLYRLMDRANKWTEVRKGMVGEAGLEPTTPGLEGRCSIQLSYSPMLLSFYLLIAAKRICHCRQRSRKRPFRLRGRWAAGGEVSSDSQVHPIRGDEGAANDQIGAATTQRYGA